MNLEDLEQIAATYLQEVTNPLVRIDVLLDRLRENEAFALLTLQDLTDFLKGHEFFKIVEPNAWADEPELDNPLVDAVHALGKCVVLVTRVPTPQDMTDLMRRQLQGMTDALKKALEKAQADGNAKLQTRLSEVLSTAEGIRDKLNVFPG